MEVLDGCLLLVRVSRFDTNLCRLCRIAFFSFPTSMVILSDAPFLRK